MSLLGGLLGIGATHAPPSPPQPDPTAPSGQGAIDPAAGSGGGSGASSTGSGPSGGSASDGSAVRFDFRPDPDAAVPEGEGERARALANQDRERIATRIERVGTPARAAHQRLLGAGAAAPEAGAYADNLKTLRGTDQPAGKLLDRAA